MTIETFRYIDNEVKDLVNTLLDKVKAASFSDYVLLSRASYQVENENTFLSPYVIQSNLEIRQDQSRERFLHTYLNQYSSLLQDNVFLSDEIHEFNLNLQLMMYSQTWESHRFLMNLKRITHILTEGRYLWRIRFERRKTKNQTKVVPIPKGKIIEEEIIQPLSKLDSSISTFLSSIYDNSIRNAFAHSSYNIDFDRGFIELLSSESYSSTNQIDFNTWEDKFFYTVLFSYHLSRSITLRLNHFIDDYPEIKEVPIQWPSFKEPGKFYTTAIYPIIINYGGMRYVEFNFVKNKS